MAKKAKIYGQSNTDEFVIDFYNEFLGKTPNEEDLINTYKQFGKNPKEVVEGLYSTYVPDKLTDDRFGKIKKAYNIDDNESMVSDKLENSPSYQDFINLQKKDIVDKAEEYGKKETTRAFSKNFDQTDASKIYSNLSTKYKEKGGIDPFASLYRYKQGRKLLSNQFKSQQSYIKDNFENMIKRNPENREEINNQYRQQIQELSNQVKEKEKELLNNLGLKREDKGIKVPEYAWDTFNEFLVESQREVYQQKAKEKAANGDNIMSDVFNTFAVAAEDLPNIVNKAAWLSESIVNNMKALGDKDINEEEYSTYFRDIAKYQQNEFQKKLSKYNKFDQGITEYIEEGEWGKAAGNAAIQLASIAPDLILQGMITSAGRVGARSVTPRTYKSRIPKSVTRNLTQTSPLSKAIEKSPLKVNASGASLYMGGKAGIERGLELSDRDDLNTFQKVSEAITYGATEALSEHLGTEKIMNNVLDVVQRQGMDITQESIRNAVRPWYGRAFQRFANFALPMAQEGAEEWANSIAQDFATKMTSDPSVKIGENAMDDFIVGAIAGKAISMPADISSLYKDVEGDSESKLIRRTLKKIPDHYDADARVDALQLEIQREIKQHKRRNSSGEYVTNLDKDIENLNTQLQEIDKKQAEKLDRDESGVAVLNQHLDSIENSIINENYEQARDDMNIDGKPIAQWLKENKNEMSPENYRSMSQRNNDLAQSIQKIRQGDIENIPNENIRKAFQNKKQTDKPKVEETTPLEIQNYATEQGFDNIHHATNSVRRYLGEEVQPEQMTKELIDQARQRRDQDKELDKDIEESQQRLGLEPAPDLNIKRETEETFDKLDKGEPVTNERLQNAEDNLYNEYKRLERLKGLRDRRYTTEQIESMQDAIGDEITELNEFKQEQKYEGQFKNFKEFKEKAEAEVEAETGTVTQEGARKDTKEEITEEPKDAKKTREETKETGKQEGVKGQEKEEVYLWNDEKNRVETQEGEEVKQYTASNNVRVEMQEGVPVAIKKDGTPYKNQNLPNPNKAINEFNSKVNWQAEPSENVETESGLNLPENVTAKQEKDRVTVTDSRGDEDVTIEFPDTNSANDYYNKGRDNEADDISDGNESVFEAAKEKGYESKQQLYADYINYGSYTGQPKPGDITVGDISSITARKTKAEKKTAPKTTQKKTTEKPKSIPEKVNDKLDSIEDSIVKGNIKGAEDTKIEGITIGKYLVNNKENLTEKQYNELIKKNNDIAKSIQYIRQGRIEEIPNKKIREKYSQDIRDIESDDTVLEQRRTYQPKASKDYLEMTIQSLKNRFPNINVTYDPTLDKPGVFTKDGVTINPNKAGEDTPIHEFAHPYVLLMKGNNEQLYSTISRLIKETKHKDGSLYFDEVKQDMDKRENETEDDFNERVTDEAITRLISEEATKIAQKKYNNPSKIRDDIKRFWDWLKQKLGILPQYDISTLSIDKFTRLAARDLFNTKPLTQEDSDVIVKRDLNKSNYDTALDNGALLYSNQGKTNMDKFLQWIAHWTRSKKEAPRVVNYLEKLKLGEIRGWLEELKTDIYDFHRYMTKNYLGPQKKDSPFNNLKRKDIGEKLNGILQENLPLYNRDDLDDNTKRQAEQMRIMQEYGFPKDQELVNKIIKLRSTVDALSNELITSGLIQGNLAATVNANMGIYLTRTFNAHKNKGWKPPEDIKNKAVSYIRSEYEKGLVNDVKFTKKGNKIDLEIYTVFSGTVKLNDLTPERAKEILEIDDQTDIFKLKKGKTVGHYQPDNALEIGYKLDNNGRYFNENFRQLDSNEINNMLENLIKSDIIDVGMRAGGSFTKSPYLGILKHRKNIPTEILEYMGVETDPYTNLYTTVNKMANLMSNHRQLEVMRDYGMGKFLFRKSDAPAGFKPISAENTDAYKPLNGLYTDPGTLKYIKSIDSPKNMGWMLKRLLKFNGIVKGGFTIWNNVTQLRNILSWTFIHASTGQSPDFSRIFKEDWKIALNDMGLYTSNKEARKWHRRLIEEHVLHENADFNDFQEFVRHENNKPGIEFSDYWIMRIARKTERKAEQLYRFGDDWNKTIYFFNTLRTYRKAYQQELDDGTMSEDDLIKEVAGVTIKTTPTYSDLGEAIKLIRKTPVVGAFVSWPTAMVKASVGQVQTGMQEIKSKYKVLQRQGYKRLIASSALMTPTMSFGMQMISQMLSGVGDDESRKLEPFIAPWDRNTAKFFLGKENGTYTYIPLSYIDPFNYTNRIMTSLIRGETENHKPVINAFKEAMKPYFGEDILFGVIADIWADIRSEEGKIVDPTGSIYDQTIDILKYGINNLKPGVIRNALRITQSFQDQKNTTKYGTEIEFMNELKTNLTGFRVTQANVKQSLYFKTLKYKEEIDKYRSAYRRYKYDRQKDNQTVINEFYRQNKNAKKEFKRMKEMIYDSYTYLGVKPKEVIEALDDSDLPKWMIDDLKNGTFTGIYSNPTERLRKDIKERNEGYK